MFSYIFVLYIVDHSQMGCKNIFVCSIWADRVPPRGTETGVNGVPTAPHGLILGEDEATACTDLLEALLAQYWPILARFWCKMIDFPGTWVSGTKKQAKKQ